MLVTTPLSISKPVFWHRELPPASAEVVGEGLLEATSVRVRDCLDERGSLWESCLADLKQDAHKRLEQELHRVGADFVHVLAEITDTRRDERTGEAWLHGTFRYVLLSATSRGSKPLDERTTES